jgi:hypothetical protein
MEFNSFRQTRVRDIYFHFWSGSNEGFAPTCVSTQRKTGCNIYFHLGMKSNEGFDPTCGSMPRNTGCAGWNLSRDPAR